MERDEKLTICVHPFYYISDEFADREETFPFEKFDGNPYTSLEENGRDDDAYIGKESLSRFKEAVDFARDGKLLILRSDPQRGYMDIERTLFGHIQESIPRKNYEFRPSLNEMIGHDNDKDDEAMLRLFDGSMNRLRDAQVYMFGEMLDACVGFEAYNIHKRIGFTKPAIVLAKYCFPFAESVDDAKGLVHGSLYDSRAGYGYDQHDVESRVNVGWDE